MGAVLNNFRRDFKQLSASVGRSALHAQYPNDFEYYACSLELLDLDGNVKDILVFPIMPSNMSENIKTNTNVKKASSSVVSLYNPSFQPFQINISGTFGKRFRILLGDGELDGVAFRLNTQRFGEYSVEIKSGYGVTKILQSMIENSLQYDENGKPLVLVFNNLSFNSSHVVEVVNYSFTQSEQQNFLYNYNVSFTALAPSYILGGNRTSVADLLILSNLNKATNSLVDNTLFALNRAKNILLK